MTYREGYFKALLDVLSFMEKLEASSIRSHKERLKVAVAVIYELLVRGKMDYFMEQGGEIEFRYKYEKGKVEVKEIGE